MFLNSPSRSARRNALSILEVLGCVVAIGGGVWIGATYFGVDLNGAAYQALDEAELLTKLPEEWRPVNPECPDGNCPDPAEVFAAEQARLQAELDELRFEVARMASGPQAKQADDRAGSLSPEDREKRDATQAYWQELGAIAFEVTAIQQRVQSIATPDDQGRVLALRRRALEYGNEATQLLPIDGVDERAVEAGVRLAEWFEHSAETIQSAIDLRSHQAVSGRSVSAANIVAQAEAELKKRTDFLRRKSAESSAYLTGRYFTDFPPLGI